MVEIFIDQTIDDQVKKQKKIMKILTGQGDNYTTGYLMDY